MRDSLHALPDVQRELKMASDSTKPLASLSLDLDNQWSYMKTHGELGWENYPSYFDILIPPLLDLLEQLELKITFFIVGQDAALKKNRESLQQLTRRGHEVGNHSFHHEPWFHLYPKERLKREIIDSENYILDVTGQKPIGFRGPGFSWNRNLFEILNENGYIYDASTLPMYLGPLARIYYFWTSDLSIEERGQRKDLYGSLKDGLKPVKPYVWQLSSGNRFLEIPVTTIPILKFPFHLSYLLYLSRFSESLMLLYLNMAITFCRITGTGPSFLLHPLDLIGGNQVPELSFFPGMDLNREQKIKIFKKVIKILSRYFKLSDMSTHAKVILNNKKLKMIRP